MIPSESSFHESIVKTIVSVMLPLEESLCEKTKLETTTRNILIIFSSRINDTQARTQIRQELKQINYMPEESLKGTLKDLSNDKRINLTIKTVNQIASAAKNFVRENLNTDTVEFYPAQEFLCVYDRDPPEIDWPLRWRAAAIAATDAIAVKILEASDRMVALKSSAIWQKLGNGAGNYVDTLGSPFPPFTFNSGFDLNPIDRVDTEKLGLLKKGDKARPAELPPSNIFIENLAAKLRQSLTQLESIELA